MEIGFGKVDVSPPPNPDGALDVPILGFWWERVKAYREIRDPLHARAAAFRADAGAVVLVAVDMIGDAIGFGAEARALAADELGLSTQQIMVACTHAHTTPETIGLCGREPARAWRDRLVRGIVDAARQALEAMQPAELRVNAGPLEGVSVNRRARVLEGADASLLARLTPEQHARTLALDPTVHVARALAPDGRTLGSLVHFACHPVAVQTQPLISADYPGLATATLESRERFGPVCLFVNGAAGDANPVERDGFDGVKRTAEALVERVASLVAEGSDAPPRAAEPEHVAWSARTLGVPRRALPARAELERQRDELAAKAAAAAPVDRGAPAGHPGVALFQVNERLALAARDAQLPAEVQALRVADQVLVGVPGELLTCLGDDIRAAGPAGRTWVVGYANGYLGYIAPEEAHIVGGYEVSPGRWSPLAPGAGETIRDAAIACVNDVVGGE